MSLYVAFEGPKGSGKSTALDHVARELARRVPVAVLCPTRPMPQSHPLELLARAPGIRCWDPFLERLYAARSNWAARRVSDASLVLGDRSVLTSLATRWDGRDGGRAVAARVRRLEPHIPTPDHVVLFDAPLPVLVARTRRRCRRYGRRDETPARLAHAVDAYAQIERNATEIGLGRVRWHHVDASQSAERVAAAALAIVESLWTPSRWEHP